MDRAVKTLWYGWALLALGIVGYLLGELIAARFGYPAATFAGGLIISLTISVLLTLVWWLRRR